MNAVDMAKMAYGSSTSPVRTPRSIEYALFTRISHRLKTATAMGPQGFGTLVQALHDNRKLWTTMAVDVAGKDNALPQSLRAQIFYLARFVDHHTRKVLKGEATADPLIDVNMAMMRGLGAEGSQA